MSDRTSDLAFRRDGAPRPPRDDDAWETLVRNELARLRSQTPTAPRVVPAGRPNRDDGRPAGESAPPAAA